METETGGREGVGGEGGPPEGARIRRGEDGSLILDLAISRDKFLNAFLPFFGLVFIGAGMLLLLRKQDDAGYIPLSIGLLVAWFGGYMAMGRLEIRLGADSLEWTRIFLKRWSTRSLERAGFRSIGTQAGVRTNGKPTSWRIELHLEGKNLILPGFHGERAILRLGEILALWAEVPFDGNLDRSFSAD